MIDHVDGNMPPNQRRNFVHKRIIGAVGGFLTGGPLGAVGGAFSPSGRSGGSPAGLPRNFGAGQSQGFRDRGGCSVGFIRRDGICQRKTPGITGAVQRFLPGGSSGFDPAAPRFGANGGGGPYMPSIDVREVRECLPGDVLGRDGFCYSKSDISNKNRAWPKGRKPLGTPGELAALAKAAAFGRRMETTVKRMQKVGVLKKPKPAARKQITSAAQHHAGG